MDNQASAFILSWNIILFEKINKTLVAVFDPTIKHHEERLKKTLGSASFSKRFSRFPGSKAVTRVWWITQNTSKLLKVFMQLSGCIRKTKIIKSQKREWIDQTQEKRFWRFEQKPFAINVKISST